LFKTVKSEERKKKLVKLEDTKNPVLVFVLCPRMKWRP